MRTQFLILLAMSSAAVAQPAPRPAQLEGRVVAPVGMLIAGFDADGDARTTRDELRQGTARAFGLADADRSGAVGLIELSRWSAVWLGDVSALPGRFDFDRDADDSISSAEFAAELDRRFVRYDADKDGVVVRGELLQTMQLRPVPLERRPRLPDPPQRGQ
jgi:Ca2+-binding EF-hand superfamily protein